MLQIILVIIAIASLTFAIWSWFKTRKYAELRFQITQIADFGIPRELVKQLAPHALISIMLESTGTKAAENIELLIKTANPIEELGFEPQNLSSELKENTLHIPVARLNPSQTLKILLSCGGDPTQNQLIDYEFTHSEGKALSRTPQKSQLSAYFADILISLIFIILLLIYGAAFLLVKPAIFEKMSVILIIGGAILLAVIAIIFGYVIIRDLFSAYIKKQK